MAIPTQHHSKTARRSFPGLRKLSVASAAALCLLATNLGGLGGLDGLSATARADFELPSIGEPADRTLSPIEERKIGESAMAQLLSVGYVLEDPLLTDYITRLGRKLAVSAGTNPNDLTFFVVRDNGINAFAIPGGYIGINSGLIMVSRTESELAGVVAHEIAHVSQRHIARQLAGNQGYGWATAALVLAAIAAGGGDPDVLQAALGLGLGSVQQRQVNHTRAHEIEADRVGIRTLSASGMDPEGMATFFERMHQTARLYGSQIPEILRTHPFSSNRVAEARGRLDRLPPSNYRDSDSYILMRARARALAAEPLGNAETHFKATLAADPDDVEAAYGLAVVDVLSGDGDAALDHIQPALNASVDQSGHVAVQIAAAQAEHFAGNGAAAKARMDQVIDAHPDHLAAPIAYAELLLKLGEPARARAVLLESSALARHLPDAYRLLALAARDTDRHGEAHYQMAAYYRHRGDYRSALSQLSAGLRRSDLEPAERARMETRESEYLKDAPQEQLYRRRGDRTERG